MKNNEKQCPYCGIRYEDFRCGYDFSSVVELMWKDEKPWPQKRRGSRLGKLHEVKMNMWDNHILTCSVSDFSTNLTICIESKKLGFIGEW